MTDDELLKALATADVKRDPRWEAFAAGTASKADEAELGALAHASPDGRAAFEAFRPLEAAARELAVDRIAASIAGRKRASRLRAAGIGVGSLGAALLALFLVRPSGTVPAYDLAAAGVEQVDRLGTPPPAGVLRFGPRSQPEITLRPAHDVGRPVAVRCWLARDGAVRAWDCPAQVAETGAVRIAGDRETVFAGVPPGRWEAIFTVGPAGDLPSDARAAEAALRRTDAPFRVLRAEVILEGPPP